MAFWSGETIKQNLATLIDKPDVNCIDGAAYTLKVGPEYYVSATELDPDRNTRTMKTLSTGESFVIPGGQFALVLTEEVVSVPVQALGFFSIRSRVKWKGLINVSGFHIDPGFSGRLTIAVYNAGSTPIHLRQGEPEFLIWFADLDAQASAKYARHATVPATKISVSVLNQAPGETESLQSLAARIRHIDEKFRRTLWIGSIVAAALVGLLLKSWFEPPANSPTPQVAPVGRMLQIPTLLPPPAGPVLPATPQTPVAPSQSPTKPQP